MEHTTEQKEFIDLVDRMLIAQADYFKSRSKSSLIRSKNLESQVKKFIKTVKDQQLKIF